MSLFPQASPEEKTVAMDLHTQPGRNFSSLNVTASKKPSQALSNVTELYSSVRSILYFPGVSPIKEFALYKLPFLGLLHLVPSRVQPNRGHQQKMKEDVEDLFSMASSSFPLQLGL